MVYEITDSELVDLGSSCEGTGRATNFGNWGFDVADTTGRTAEYVRVELSCGWHSCGESSTSHMFLNDEWVFLVDFDDRTSSCDEVEARLEEAEVDPASWTTGGTNEFRVGWNKSTEGLTQHEDLPGGVWARVTVVSAEL